MRIGSFWGLPAPMIILLLESNRERLQRYLLTASEDTKKEFIFLSKISNLQSYKLPKIQKVSEDLGPFCRVVNGKIEGESELVVVQLETEIRNIVIKKILQNSLNDEWKSLPENLMAEIDKVVKECSFSMEELDEVAEKVIENLPKSDFNNLAEWANQFDLEIMIPDEIVLNDNRVKLSENQFNAIRYFTERKDLLQDCISYCSEKVTEERIVFGVSFFDLIVRKPSSIMYIVAAMFEDVKGKRDPKPLQNVIDSCKEEIQRYKICFEKYVCSNENVIDQDFTMEEAIKILNEHESVEDYFLSLLKTGKISVSELTEDNFIMLVDLKERIMKLSSDTILEKLGCSGSLNSVVEELVKVGIIGVNDKTTELFDDSLLNFVLDNDAFITKSDDDVYELERGLRDIDALLDTLRPIGGKI